MTNLAKPFAMHVSSQEAMRDLVIAMRKNLEDLSDFEKENREAMGSAWVLKYSGKVPRFVTRAGYSNTAMLESAVLFQSGPAAEAFVTRFPDECIGFHDDLPAPVSLRTAMEYQKDYVRQVIARLAEFVD
jgi:hypothetical protein